MRTGGVTAGAEAEAAPPAAETLGPGGGAVVTITDSVGATDGGADGGVEGTSVPPAVLAVLGELGSRSRMNNMAPAAIASPMPTPSTINGTRDAFFGVARGTAVVFQPRIVS